MVVCPTKRDMYCQIEKVQKKHNYQDRKEAKVNLSSEVIFWLVHVANLHPLSEHAIELGFVSKERLRGRRTLHL